ncbi:unnamed protein product [Prunus armeniaca]
MDQIAPCIHDELALFVKKYRRVVKDKTKVTRNCQNLSSSSTCVCQDNIFKEMNFLNSYGFREDKSLKGLVKCYLCGGAGHIDVECANNHMTKSNKREESISAQWIDSDSDDSNNYITSSYEEANNFALVGSVHNSSLARVHEVKERKYDSGNEFVSGDDRQDDQSYRVHDNQSYKEQDDQSYRELCEKYDMFFNETCNFKEHNHMVEEKVKDLDELIETLKMAKRKSSDSLYENEVDMYELYHKVRTLEKENSNLIEKLNVLENDKSLLLHKLILFEFEKSLVEHEKVVVHDKFVVENSVLQCMLFEKDIEIQNLFEMVKSLENNMVKQSYSFDALQFENIRLEHELELEKEKIEGLTIGAGKIDKMLNFGKLFGDKRGLGYIDESSTPSSFETIFVKDMSAQEAPKFVHGLNLGFDSMNIVSKGKLSLPQSKFMPTCHHCGVKGHIRPRCHILRIESQVSKESEFKTHVSSFKGYAAVKSMVCTRDKHSSLAKFGFLQPQRFIPICHHCGTLGHIRPKCFEYRNFEKKPFVHFKKVNDDSLQTKVNDLLYKAVKIPKVISMPHKVSKVKQVWIKKEDHVLPHVGD